MIWYLFVPIMMAIVWGWLIVSGDDCRYDE